MSKRRKNSVSTSKKKNKNRIPKNEQHVTAQSSNANFKPQPLSRYEIFLERLESNPKFVGAIKGSLYGVLTGVIIFVVVMMLAPTRIFFFYVSRRIFSYLPETFIPPKMFFPAHLVAPLMFIPLIGGAIYGARYSTARLPQHEDKSSLDFKEKIWLFVTLLVIFCIAGTLSLMEHPPKENLLKFFNSPEFIIPATIVLIGCFVWSFSTAKNDETNNFRLRVYLLLAIVVSLVVAIFYTLQSILLYALR